MRGLLHIASALAAVAATCVVATPAAVADHRTVKRPHTPNFVGDCSNAKEAFLKKAWWEAYRYMRSADDLIDYIADMPESARVLLWDRDNGPGLVPSPRHYFGPYKTSRFNQVRNVIEKGHRRFTLDGPLHWRGIRRFRCRTDFCAEDPEAFHYPGREIALCPKFWRAWSGNDLSDEEMLAYGAHTLVHETLHWLQVDSPGVDPYVTDFHGISKGGIPYKKYYGMANVEYLAENGPNYAVLNNDTYAFFTQAVKRAPDNRIVTGVFAAKEGGGTGGLFRDLTKKGLESRVQQLAPQQYLADVETYVRAGHRLYTGVWRIGPGGGPGHLFVGTKEEFVDEFAIRKKTQELIDIEVYRGTTGFLGLTPATLFVGVFRDKAPGSGVTGLFVEQTWDSIVAKNDEYAAGAYLADIEAYRVGSKTFYVGVWRVGPGGGGTVFRTAGVENFESTKVNADKTQQLVDYERDGALHIGVWRILGAPGQGRTTDRTWPAFLTRWEEIRPGLTLIDVEEFSTLASQLTSP